MKKNKIQPWKYLAKGDITVGNQTFLDHSQYLPDQNMACYGYGMCVVAIARADQEASKADNG